MGAVKLDEETLDKQEAAVETAELKPTVLLKDNVLHVTFKEDEYEKRAKDAGFDKKEILRFKKFNDSFISDIVTATGDALIDGYKKHGTATEFTMKYETPVNVILQDGKKLNTTKVTGTETQFAGFGLKVVTKVAGIGALQKAKKKELFESYGLK